MDRHIFPAIDLRQNPDIQPGELLTGDVAENRNLYCIYVDRLRDLL